MHSMMKMHMMKMERTRGQQDNFLFAKVSSQSFYFCEVTANPDSYMPLIARW